jgi:hypothetical protein
MSNDNYCAVASRKFGGHALHVFKFNCHARYPGPELVDDLSVSNVGAEAYKPPPSIEREVWTCENCGKDDIREATQ